MALADFQDQPEPAGPARQDINYVKEAFHMAVQLDCPGGRGGVCARQRHAPCRHPARRRTRADVPGDRPAESHAFSGWCVPGNLRRSKKHQQKLESRCCAACRRRCRAATSKLRAGLPSIRAISRSFLRTSQIFLQQMDPRLRDCCTDMHACCSAASQQQQYMKTTDPDEIKSEIAATAKAPEHRSPRVQDINKKRIEILSKRLEKYEKINENCQVVDAQMCGRGRRAAAGARPVGDHARSAAGQRAAGQPGARRGADRTDRAAGGIDFQRSYRRRWTGMMSGSRHSQLQRELRAPDKD